MPRHTSEPWNLVADIGGTNARFGLQDSATGELCLIRSYPVAEYPRFGDALDRFLAEAGGAGQWAAMPAAACLAVASVTSGEVIQFTNNAWQVDRAELRARLDGLEVDIVNDFEAVGYAVAELAPADWRQIGAGAPEPGRPVAVLGPGTGLGVCALVPLDGGYTIVEGEGGHVDFAPVSEREIRLLQRLTRRFGRVSVERLLSGPGIINIYRALAELDDEPAVLDSPGAVTAAAVAGTDILALETLQIFCAVLGSVAGNLALTLGARGGVYIAGGILPRLVDFAEHSGLRERFEAKGRFSPYVSAIPLRVVTRDNLGLTGAMKRLVALSLRGSLP